LKLPAKVTERIAQMVKNSHPKKQSIIDRLLWVWWLPLEICTESFLNWTGTSKKAANFGFDMAVRNMHGRGLIKRYFFSFQNPIYLNFRMN
jgi:hypothetical protein